MDTGNTVCVSSSRPDFLRVQACYYFLKLKTLDFDQLWTDYLQPLLQEYVQGMYDEEELMSRFARAYGYQESARGDSNEVAQD